MFEPESIWLKKCAISPRQHVQRLKNLGRSSLRISPLTATCFAQAADLSTCVIFLAVKIRHGVAQSLGIPFSALINSTNTDNEVMKRMTTMSSGPSNTNQYAVKLTAQSNGIASTLCADIGIDKVKVTFPINSETGRKMLGLRTIHIHHSVEGQDGASAVASGAFRFSGYVYVRRDATFWASAEFNPSRLNNPSGWECISVLRLTDVLESVWPTLEDTFHPATTLSEASVSRLDVTRDFAGVINSEKYLKRLDTNARAFKNLNRGHHVSPTNEGWSLKLSTKSGGTVFLYDKHRESRGRAPEGSIRFEVQLRGWLESYGSQIRTVADITADAVEHAARGWWDRSQFGRPIASGPDILTEVRAVLEGQRNAATLANAVYAYYLRAQDGDEAMEISPSTRRRYESILRRAEDFASVDSQGAGKERRLDLECGREVVASD